MTEILLRRELEPAAQQQHRVALLRRLTRWWIALILLAVGALVLQRYVSFPAAPLFVVLGGVLVLAGIGWASSERAVDYKALAHKIAERNPDLHALLLAAVEQERDAETGRLGYLQERVLTDALAEIRRHENLEAVPRSTLASAHALHATVLVVFLGLLLLMPEGKRGALAKTSLFGPRVTVTPGDTSIEKGNGLVVLAKFEGSVPGEATLVVITNGIEHRIPLAKNLNDPVFGGSIPEVTTPMKYRVEFGTEKSSEFNVSVFEFPRLDRADASITYPAYTELQPKKINDTRRVSAVEGSQMDLALQLNKPVKSARLIAKDNSVIPLATETNRAQAHLNGYKFERSQKYELQLVDADGRTNKLLTQFSFDALTNQRPQLRITSPRGDKRVSSLQEVSFTGEAQDDFGLRGWGLTYSIGGEEPKTVALGGTAGAHVKTNFAHLLRLEELQLKPDQLLSYFVWADDFGPDGQMRRTSSDMFFAEVRPFEEIFREGENSASQQQQQQQQQQGGNQSPATKLAELQKQIINATWKLQRNETGAKPSEKYSKDEPVVRDSQENALSQVDELAEQLNDLRMKEFAETAAKHMTVALEQLNAATNSAKPLPKALAAEQAAYQAVLKLQSREFQVTQQRQQRGQQQQQRSAQPNQSQLSQLDLKKQQDRYEMQREAQPQQPQQKKEQLEALNRLKELAQRQQDINERLKEMQTELQAAKTEKEKEELTRELKRLREEQREMLADMDQLKQQMEKPENQSEMAESRQQLEQARQEAEKASEALEQNSVQQALASGTRAERQLEKTRDDMRKQSSSQFSEEMKQMRNEARELAEKQQEIRKELQEQNDKPKSLSDNGETQQLANKLGEQKAAVTNLLDQMKRVTDQAEVAEPLLSKQLYDTLRRSSQGNLDQSLTAAEELSKRNFLREASQFEQRAGKEIEALKNDVEKAAQSVLGDDTESLRMAKRELDQLTAQLQNELSRVARTNSALSNATAAAMRGGTNQGAGRLGSNGIAFASGGTNGTNIASGRGRGTNENLAMNDTNGTARGVGGTNGTNSTSGRELASNQRGSRQRQQNNLESPPRAQQQGERQPGQQGERGQGQGQRGGNDEQQTANAEPQNQNQDRQNQQPGDGQQQNGSRRGGNRGDRLAQMFDNQNQQRGNNQQQQRRDGGAQDGGFPLTGSTEFTEWNQRLSNVEEMVDRPALRNQIAQARDRARAARAEFKRHSKNPQWDLVQMQILGPLIEVRDRVADELSRRDSNESLAPIDRDPVPGKYGDLVRRYYETLGGSQ